MESMEGLMVVNEMARDAVFHMLMEDGIHVRYMDGYIQTVDLGRPVRFGFGGGVGKWAKPRHRTKT